jgi:hypothetical protein
MIQVGRRTPGSAAVMIVLGLLMCLGAALQAFLGA